MYMFCFKALEPENIQCNHTHIGMNRGWGLPKYNNNQSRYTANLMAHLSKRFCTGYSNLCSFSMNKDLCEDLCENRTAFPCSSTSTSTGYKVTRLDLIWSLNLTSQRDLFPMSHVGTTADSSLPKNELFCGLVNIKPAETYIILPKI